MWWNDNEWASSSNGRCQKCVPGTFSTKRRSRQTPQTPACTRVLWTASIDLAKFIALHAGTLNRSVWDPRFSEVRAAGCKWHRYIPGTHQTISGYVQQIRLCHKNTISCLYLQSVQQHYRGSHVYGVNMEDDALFSSSSRRLPHRRVGANAHRIVELGQTCIIFSVFHLPRCRAQCCAVCIDKA